MKTDHTQGQRQRRCLPRLVRLSTEDRKNLSAAAKDKRGYITPTCDPRTGEMVAAQFKSWCKLQRLGLADLAPRGGEVEELEITDAGRAALANTSRETPSNE